MTGDPTPLPGPAIREPMTIASAPDRGPFDELRTLAEAFADAQKTRVGLGNRLSSGTVPENVSSAILADQRRTEKLISNAMVASFRRATPEIRRWTIATPGLGEPSMARLIGIIGHPIIARPHHWEGEGKKRVLVADEPFERNVAKLWAYCGHGDPERKKRKGMSATEAMALGNPRAKTVIHLIAENVIKEPGRKTRPKPNEPADTPSLVNGGQQPEEAKRGYRRLYEETRLRYWIDHTEWGDGHQLNAALHLVAKEILRDLWLVARGAKASSVPMPLSPHGLDSAGDGQTCSAPQTGLAVAGNPESEAA